MKRILLIVGAMLSFTGCAYIYGLNYSFPVPEKYGANLYWKLNAQQKVAFLKSEKRYDDETIKLILDRSIQGGMTQEQVKYSWGKPEKINEMTSRLGLHEQWVYPPDRFLYFENGQLTSWQLTQQ